MGGLNEQLLKLGALPLRGPHGTKVKIPKSCTVNSLLFYSGQLERQQSDERIEMRDVATKPLAFFGTRCFSESLSQLCNRLGVELEVRIQLTVFYVVSFVTLESIPLPDRILPRKNHADQRRHKQTESQIEFGKSDSHHGFA